MLKHLKLEIDHGLKDLGDDVIAAGFPIASHGDFESVQELARQVHPGLHGLLQAGVGE